MRNAPTSPGDEDSILASVLAKTGKPAPQEAEKPRQSARPSWTLPGFHGKARITTLFGELPIEALRRRDEVKLHTGRFSRIEWIDKIQLDEAFLSYHPDGQPVLLRANVLGPGKPKVDMMVSPAQMLDSRPVHMPSALLTARDLGQRPNVMRRSLTNVTYYLFHTGEEACVSVEGLWCHTSP